MCLQHKSKLKNRKVKLSGQENAKCVTPLPKVSVTLTEFQLAEKEVLKFIQREHFYEEIRVLMKLKVVGEEVSIRELAKFVYLFIYLFKDLYKQYRCKNIRTQVPY